MSYHTVINACEDYIEEHFKDKLLIDDLAKHVGVSKYHLQRIFKQETNETLHQFILRRRLERSLLVLRLNHTLTVTEIAHLYGFHDSSAYIHAFKSYFKQSPTVIKIAPFYNPTNM